MERSRQGQTGFLEKMEPRVPAGTTKPVKMDKKTKDGCRRRPSGDKGRQYATITVATWENSDGTCRKGRCDPSRQHPDFSRRMHEGDSSAGGATTRHSKGTRRSDKGCQKIPKVMFQFIVLLAIANATQAVPINAELPVKVGPLPNNTGKYVELRNRIALMSAQWTIISYFDLRLLAQEITAFKKNIEDLSTWCLRAGSCPTIIQVLEQEASELYDGQQLFNHQRQRRGALNLVGNLANGLFGVLDSQYAQNMEEVIRKIQAKGLHNTHLLRNQTSILDSTINVMRTSNDEMERRIRHMETHVTDLENTIRTGNIAQVSSELTLIAGHIKRTQTAVINIVTGLKRGIVSKSAAKGAYKHTGPSSEREATTCYT